MYFFRLYDQWEEDEEPLPEDELPEHLRKPPSLDLTKMDMSNPEEVLQATKKGQTLMMFVTVANKPSRARTEELTKIWQSSLWGNHIQAERYFNCYKFICYAYNLSQGSSVEHRSSITIQFQNYNIITMPVNK